MNKSSSAGKESPAPRSSGAGDSLPDMSLKERLEAAARSSPDRPLADALREAMSLPLPPQQDVRSLSTAWQSKSNSKAAKWKSYMGQQMPMLAIAVDLELPSGMEIKAVRPSIFVLMQQGRIPDALTPLIDRMIADALGDPGQSEGRFIQNVVKDFQESPAVAYDRYKSLLNVVWMESVVDPIFVYDPDNLPVEVRNKLESLPEEERFVLPIAGVSLEDQMYLFNWCQGVTESVTTFRDRQRASLANSPELQRLWKVAM